MDAKGGVTWIAYPKIPAAKRKQYLEQVLNDGENGINLRANQSTPVTKLSASIAKNEMLRLIEVRMQEKGKILILMPIFFYNMLLSQLLLSMIRLLLKDMPKLACMFTMPRPNLLH